jgi:hypothetical protein
VVAPDDLHADRQSVDGADGDGDGRVAGEVGRHGEGTVVPEGRSKPNSAIRSRSPTVVAMGPAALKATSGLVAAKMKSTWAKVSAMTSFRATRNISLAPAILRSKRLKATFTANWISGVKSSSHSPDSGRRGRRSG